MRASTVLPLALALAAAPLAAARGTAAIQHAGRLEVAAAVTSDLPLELEILKGFARSLGADLGLTRSGSVAAALAAVASGRADVAAGGLVSSRDSGSGAAFTGEAFASRLVAVNREPAEPARFIEALRNAEAILAPTDCGAAEAAAAAKLPATRTVTTLTTEQALEALRAGGSKVALVGLLDALAARRRDPRLQVGVALGVRQPVAFAVARSDAALLAALDDHLRALRASPSYRLLLLRTLGPGALDAIARAHLE